MCCPSHSTASGFINSGSVTSPQPSSTIASTTHGASSVSRRISPRRSDQASPPARCRSQLNATHRPTPAPTETLKPAPFIVIVGFVPHGRRLDERPAFPRWSFVSAAVNSWVGWNGDCFFVDRPCGVLSEEEFLIAEERGAFYRVQYFLLAPCSGLSERDYPHHPEGSQYPASHRRLTCATHKPPDSGAPHMAHAAHSYEAESCTGVVRWC